MNDLFSLAGKTALVTGAGSGLGRQFAQTLAAAGARVVLAARRPDKLADTEAKIASAGGIARSIVLDLTDSAAIAAAIGQLQSEDRGVDVLVNNAGVSGFASLDDCDEPNWDAIFSTNVKSVWLLSRAVVNAARRENKASIAIVNIASILARDTKFGLGPYMASKAAVQQLTKAMALEWAADGVRANAIAPGYFPSEMTEGLFDSPEGQAMQSRIPLGRTGQLAELAGPLLLLASDASSYMNGATITVDGGHLCRTL